MSQGCEKFARSGLGMRCVLREFRVEGFQLLKNVEILLEPMSTVKRAKEFLVSADPSKDLGSAFRQHGHRQNSQWLDHHNCI
jgi:hypothetical protein